MKKIFSMIPNNSPWLHQLKRTRPVDRLTRDIETDVVIVGGGIAGVVTAYFILKNTKLRVALLEGSKIAHGATGHNAGQLASYFERPFVDIVREFGLEAAAAGQAAIESAWELLESIVIEAQLKTPCAQFTGYAGCSSYEQILLHLENNKLRAEAGLVNGYVLVAEEFIARTDIPVKYDTLYATVPQAQILALLETNDTRYVAALSAHKGCMNSALFTEELVGYLLSAYHDRFVLTEHTRVFRVVLGKERGVLQTEDHLVTANQIVLCTNGFENIAIINKAGVDIDTKFHHLIEGKVGYMTAYLESLNKPPTALSYFVKSTTDAEEPYYYLTRRPFEKEKNEEHNLISVGGPEISLRDKTVYHKDHPYPEYAEREIDAFVRQTYRHAPKKQIEYMYHWHGLMGYTPNRLRLIGPEPCNPILLYNLGCNGVGILPSIYGGYRIGEILAGKKLEKSIFDPADARSKKKN